VTSPQHRPEGATEADVAAFLRSRPGFLAEHAELYRILTPPERVYGEPFADHMAAMLRAARRHAQAMAAQADGVLAAGRAAAGFAQRIQQAALAIIRARSVAECVETDLPAILGIDAARLCAEQRIGGPVRVLAAGTVARLLGARDAVLRDRPADAALLHEEAAALAVRDALVRVPDGCAPALLALACRDPAALDASGLAALAFLGQAIGAALAR
jgi:uncharacterized protein YigA (DUF484 family)